jgi:hypothetical protein
MRDVALSINFYLYNLTADERQRGSHEIVQSRENSKNPSYYVIDLERMVSQGWEKKIFYKGTQTICSDTYQSSPKKPHFFSASR